MQEILTRAGCFIAIIFMGYILRKKNFFKEGDFTVLSKIVLKITLPAAIVSSFAGKEIDLALLSLALISLGQGIIYMIVMYVINAKRGTWIIRLIGSYITNGIYNNSNGHLPVAPGRIWYEADINYKKGKRNKGCFG